MRFCLNPCKVFEIRSILRAFRATGIKAGIVCVCERGSEEVWRGNGVAFGGRRTLLPSLSRTESSKATQDLADVHKILLA